MHGICVTIVWISVTKMINETIPVYKLGSLGVFTHIMISIGYSIVLGMGIFLPKDDYNPSIHNDQTNNLAKQANINDTFWRWMYLFPCFLNIYMLLIFFIFIKEDSIIFNLANNNDQQALNLIKKVYQQD